MGAFFMFILWNNLCFIILFSTKMRKVAILFWWPSLRIKTRNFLPELGYNTYLLQYDWSTMNTSNDPLHGKKLADILDELLDYYGGFEGLSRKIEIRCFCIDPSVKSSLRFLRTTPWAREKVENLYLYVLRQKNKQKP